MHNKRLYMDWQRMQLLHKSSDLIDIEAFGDPPERYILTYSCKGLIWLPGNPAPSISHQHRFELYLNTDYPRLPPVFHCLTSIFHPNILPPERNGGVCIGSWTPAETLDSLCIRLGEMIQYRNYSLTDALDLKAAKWATAHQDSFPLDTRDFWNHGKEADNEIILL